MSNLVKRIIFGLLGGALLIFLITFSHYSFICFVCVLSILAFDEVYGLFGGKKDLTYVISQIINTSSLLIIYLNQENNLDIKYLLIAACLLFLIPIVKLFQKNDRVVQDWSHLIFSFFYTTFPFALFVSIAYFNSSYEANIVLGILFLIWANDTAAYFAGKALGKTKLFERISPKKTWEGSIGGLAGSMIVAYFLGKYFIQLEVYQWMSIAVITTVIGSIGDLVESMIKRNLDIKDSGSLIPGHGGILDRFDALLLAMPFIFIFLQLSNL